ncbi:fatty acid/phospholipid synthesis protein [Mesoplasma florum L1]|uniref:Phosphate acyltransferase n=1 Tax=Mesoplasma florum (strain ATCC 33453 / NBRC 100688 / NCTC 11704 / L1) TaxID=265311 RepID=PLSX_MESFL|nr:phosphate acyltransferase PlsX [Mesoplasma florum]Q6F1N6.1 RecName: Full=Phosphate acyltransferase; AltName: Full=Acyl-ACP phosphotransacylase; AltName: Full=Acyl-[acyl-carrier-protein]--phosphate acyltransferase; AltName: Full=Phosphate-acyl-ACP acyltransferase [Mesoplasma florum L1]AAT75587.1 fatty acid/phospholipid synthesis protein [Mesoplasma florum L1]ATI73185.1 phosphate acyltransferase [Mesoplasma florum]ATI73872.1 phosphate acyltransferase [Mesoplasma florum]AVN58838.1 phosphate ac
MYKIAFDVMGSDNGSAVAIEAASRFIKSRKDLYLVFVGDEDQIKTSLEKFPIDESRFEILATKEFIDMNGSIMDIRRKKDSSMVRALETLKDKKVDAMITGGNSAAFIAGSHFILGELNGISRPGFMPTLPTAVSNKLTLLLDVGANLEADIEDIIGYAKMANIYAKNVLKIENPLIAQLNIGEEKSKGTLLQKEIYKELESDENINFFGNLESRDILAGKVDIIVTDGYTGNMCLKAFEGASKILMTEIKSQLYKTIFTKLKALTLKKSFDNVSKKFDYKNHSGAILLGVEGIAFKAHGSSDVKSFEATLRMTCDAVENDVLNKIKKELN